MTAWPRAPLPARLSLVVRLTLAVLAGAAWWWALPPRSWWWLAIVAAGLLAAALEDAGWTSRVLVGLAAGLAYFGPAMWWARALTIEGYALAVPLEALLLGAALVLVPRRAVLVGLPAALAVVEAVRLRWPFGGLGVSIPALSQASGPLAAAGSLGGPLLVTGLVAATGAAGAAWWRHARRGRVVPAGPMVALLLVAALAATGWVVRRATTRTTTTVRVAIVQAGHARRDQAALADLVARTRALPANVQLVLWPEATFHVTSTDTTDPILARVADLARTRDTTIVVGALHDLGQRTYHNLAVVVGPDGHVDNVYVKAHRVPFGEYLPARSVLGAVVDSRRIGDQELPGHAPGVIRTPLGQAGIAISYEAWFARHVRDAVARGARIVLAPTKVDHFPGVQVPPQEVATARLRATETGRVVLLVSQMARSAIIGPDGEVLAATRFGEDGSRTAGVPLRDGLTPFVRVGGGPVLVLAGLLLAGGWVATRTSAVAELDGPGPGEGEGGDDRDR